MFEFALDRNSTTLSTPKRRIKIHVLDVCLILLITYLVWNNNLSFNIQMSSHNFATPTASTPPKENIVPKALPMSLKSNEPSILKQKEEKKPILKTTSKSISTTSPSSSAPAANNFSNISAVLVDNFTKKYRTTEVEVERRKNTCEQYVKRFSSVAIAEMKKYGIPASITLAQGLLESDAGGSRLSRQNNNHFGMKCFSKRCKKGHCSNFTDDTHKDFFRNYQNAWESYRAHSELLQASRYRHLKKLGTKNYKDWAHGLRKAGYATDKRYAEKLIMLIEKMNLNRFDL